MKEFIISNRQINLGKFHSEILESGLKPILVEGLKKNEQGNTIELKLIFEEENEVLENIINDLLLLHNPIDVIVQEVDEEKAFMAEAIIQMSNEIENLKNEINILKGGN